MNHLLDKSFWLRLAGACVAAILATVPLAMNEVMDRGYELAKQSIAYPLVALALGAIVLGTAWGARDRAAMLTRLGSALMAVFLALAVMSTLTSGDSAVAWFGEYNRREGLLAWLLYGAFFFVVVAWAARSRAISGILDILLLASVVPAGYAILQRVGLDIYGGGVADLARPGSTLGNPVFLAAYLALLAPLTAARCWQAPVRSAEFRFWGIVAALQCVGLLLSQTRGPLLALMLGGGLFACLTAVWMRHRRVFAGAAAILVLLATGLVAINASEELGQTAQRWPVLGRLVFDLDSGARLETHQASTSATARLALWGVGSATFNDASLQNKLLGFGPDSAYLHFFPHMQPMVIRLQGYGYSHLHNRLHADSLDIILNLGFLAWLVYCAFFCVVVYAAVRALFSLEGRAPAGWFVACVMVGGGVAAYATVAAQFASGMMPAAGLGIAGGWFVFIAVCAWRALQGGLPAMPAERARDWKLLAGLLVALSVFWLDAQVNIPVLTTRLISFALAALLLVVAAGFAREGKVESAVVEAPVDWMPWGIAFILAVSCADFLPLAIFDVPGMADLRTHWGLRLLPLVVFLPFALCAGALTEQGLQWARWSRRRVAIAFGLPLAFGVVQLAWIPLSGFTLDFARVWTLSIASMVAPVALLAACVACAVTAGEARDVSAGAAPHRIVWAGIGFFGALVVAVTAMNASAVFANVASTHAPLVARGEPELSTRMIEAAVRLQPYERHYRRQLVFDLLARAEAGIGQLAQNPKLLDAVVQNLGDAEVTARAAALRFPDDPWVNVALANVRQMQGLSALRPLDPDGGLLAAREANRLFAFVHRMFPAEPLVLRNWAELLFDQGNVPDAYALLDRMEQLVPYDPAPYLERLRIAIKIDDKSTVSQTVARAQRALDPRAFSQIWAVANPQQIQGDKK